MLVKSGAERWSNPPEIFKLKSRGAARPVDAFWAEMEGLLAAKSALASPFVQQVVDGSAPRESLQRFARDLCVLASELPLIEGEIASRAALHGVDTVILLSYGTTLAFGYATPAFGFSGRAPLPELTQRLAQALGVPDAGAASRRASIFLSCMRSLGLEWLEAGVAATSIDSQWAALAPRLKSGLREHYAVPEQALECFDAWGAFDGPRTTERPLLLKELGQSGYHQYVITHAIRESSSVWRHMWDGWLSAPPEEDSA
jgi:hypothetical protein